MRNASLPLLVLLATGCTGPDDATDSGLDDTAADSGLVDPIPACADGELALNGDLTALAGRLAHPGEARIGAWHIDLAGEFAPSGAALAQAEAQGIAEVDAAAAFRLCLPADVPAADLRPGDDGAMTFATYIVGAYVDSSGDGEAGPGDRMVGVREELLAFIKGTEPDAIGEWNWLTLDYREDGEVLSIVALADEPTVELPGALMPAVRASLTGTITEATGNATTSVGLVNALGLDGKDTPPAQSEVATVTADATAAGATFSISGAFDGVPAPDHMVAPDEDNPGVSFAAYFVLAYGDNNASGDFNLGDAAYAASHLEGGTAPDPTYVAYLEPTTLLGGLYLLISDIEPGWQVADDEEGPDGFITPRDWSTGVTLAPDIPSDPPPV